MKTVSEIIRLFSRPPRRSRALAPGWCCDTGNSSSIHTAGETAIYNNLCLNIHLVQLVELARPEGRCGRMRGEAHLAGLGPEAVPRTGDGLPARPRSLAVPV